LILIIKDEKIICDLFKKSTNSGKYLNLYSNHPLEHKKGVIINLLDKTLILSNPQFHRKNLEDIINILIKNGYPLNLIFDTINKRIKLSKSDINVHFNEIFYTL